MAHYQIGWSRSHRRDIRLEVTENVSAPLIRIARYTVNGEVTYVSLLMAEACRLYNALGKVLNHVQQTEKVYQEPDKSNWSARSEDDDDPVGSD